MSLIARLREWARALKREAYALWLAYRDPRTPWYAKLVGAIVVGYAFSPIDLVPDFIPVLGYLDDAVLLPLGIALAIRLVPREVMDECREKAALAEGAARPRCRAAAVVIVAIWLAAAAAVGTVVWWLAAA